MIVLLGGFGVTPVDAGETEACARLPGDLPFDSGSEATSRESTSPDDEPPATAARDLRVPGCDVLARVFVWDSIGMMEGAASSWAASSPSISGFVPWRSTPSRVRRADRNGSDMLRCLGLCVLTVAVAVSAYADEPLEKPTEPPSSTEQQQPESKSGYDDVRGMGGPTSVGGQLAADDTAKKPLINFNWLHERFYEHRKYLKNRYGLALNIDYNFLNQYASFSFDDRKAASGTFRVYGRWSPRTKKGRPGNGLVFRFENRHQIGPGTTPRNLGFDAGSALSTASFKEFGWGTTALYWEQGSLDEKIGFVAGHMDPGDWEDLHPLLNAYTAFLNDASFNNPTTALPNQGLGIAARAFVSDQIYLKGGLHDANGEPTSIDFESFFDVQEYFTWVEVGWAPDFKSDVLGESVHLTLWHADPRTEAGTLESWGVTFSAAHEYGEKWIPYIRAGYSEGGAALLRAMLTVGTGVRIRSDDLLGVAASWGSPPQGEEGRDQFGVEAFYRLQLTHNLQITPGFQWTLNPAYNRVRNSIWVASVLRIRFVL